MQSIKKITLLICGVLTLCVIWLFVLPGLSRRYHLSERNQQLSARGIDPSALFYSELECMPRIKSHLHQIWSDDPTALWVCDYVESTRSGQE